MLTSLQKAAKYEVMCVVQKHLHTAVCKLEIRFHVQFLMLASEPNVFHVVYIVPVNKPSSQWKKT